MKTLEREVLGLATEDRYGLWEALWLLRTKCPQVGEPELQDMAKRIVSNLLTAGYIYISRYDPRKEAEDILSREQALKEIDNAANWLPPAQEKRYIAFSSMEAGDKIYYKEHLP